jgi:hypothetical protein
LATLLGFGTRPQGPSVRHVDKTAPELYDPLVLQLPEGSSDRLPVGPDHRPQVLVGVVGGYLHAVITSHHPLALQKEQEQTRQAGGNIS